MLIYSFPHFKVKSHLNKNPIDSLCRWEQKVQVVQGGPVDLEDPGKQQILIIVC